ncbi:MAG TPA: hypothetical protein VJB35_00520 [Candidatus Nanoarchaeia archaeon]|nr:hypothetical protein [Candidatus Nanoarchaeia archaeon]
MVICRLTKVLLENGGPKDKDFSEIFEVSEEGKFSGKIFKYQPFCKGEIRGKFNLTKGTLSLNYLFNGKSSIGQIYSVERQFCLPRNRGTIFGHYFDKKREVLFQIEDCDKCDKCD